MSEDRDSAADLANRAYRSGRLRDATYLLPILGVVLYTTPVLRVFTAETRVLGIPLVFVFLYGTWAILILLNRLLARRLVDETDP